MANEITVEDTNLQTEITKNEITDKQQEQSEPSLKGIILSYHDPESADSLTPDGEKRKKAFEKYMKLMNSTEEN